jgi:anti-sigma factor RsiW
LRLDLLGRGGRAFGPAYDALLVAAPVARLQGTFADLVAANGPARMRRRPLWALAAAVVLLIAGGLIGYLAAGALASRPEPPGWRQVVAEYQGLTTTETLAAIPNNPEVIAQELAAIGGTLALDLSSDKLTLLNAELKRADLFRFRDKPLVQLAYLTADSGPVSFCIIANGRPDAARAFEEREGFNVVYWNDAGRGYMLIGKAPRAALEAYAGELAARV